VRACHAGVEEEEEEEEEGLFKADAVNEEDPERDRATQVLKTCSAAACEEEEEEEGLFRANAVNERRRWWAAAACGPASASAVPLPHALLPPGRRARLPQP